MYLISRGLLSLKIVVGYGRVVLCEYIKKVLFLIVIDIF